ncbi:hypothetical protein [Lactobacillus helveticus]|uniref:hypothetical protein n=1 Tax=Lactobacillus helveticus TaxID=1587 RepID=UPI0013FD377F|nr:hypothetical protein [Lactobacillus helveticus]NHL84440.1 hypothetical protein [Lactobacillus helveticus]
MKTIFEILWKQKKRRFVKRLKESEIKLLNDTPIVVKAWGRNYTAVGVYVNDKPYLFITHFNPFLRCGQELTLKDASPVNNKLVWYGNCWINLRSVPCLVVSGLRAV